MFRKNFVFLIINSICLSIHLKSTYRRQFLGTMCELKTLLNIIFLRLYPTQLFVSSFPITNCIFIYSPCPRIISITSIYFFFSLLQPLRFPSTLKAPILFVIISSLNTPKPSHSLSFFRLRSLHLNSHLDLFIFNYI